MQTCFNDLDTLLNNLDANYADAAEAMAYSLSECIVTDTSDTTIWERELHDSIEDLKIIIDEVRELKKEMKSIYDSVYPSGG